MSTYEPGTVAVATVRGEPNVRVMRRDNHWVSGDYVHTLRTHDDHHVTDVRPLVVLDLEALPFPKSGLEEFLRNLRYGTIAKDWLADQIESQTKPPRIPEPGLWAVVEASSGTDRRCEWLHKPSGWHPVQPHRFANAMPWPELIDPVLIRDGIEDGAS